MENDKVNQCLKCNRTIYPRVITFNCSHQFCPSCFASEFFKSPLSNIFFDDNRDMTIDCSCQKGKVKLNMEQISIYLGNNHIKPPLCDNHHEECTSFCKKCKIWLCPSCLSLFHNSYFTNHSLSLVPLESNDLLCQEHSKRLKVKCLTCKVNICSTCLIENHIEHKVINHKELIKSKLKFATFDDYNAYLTKREIELKDELHFTNQEICLKLDACIQHLSGVKQKMIENYYCNCRFITYLNTFNRKLYYYLYEKAYSNDPEVNLLLDLPSDDALFIDIGLKHYPQTDYDSILELCKTLSHTRIDCNIQLVKLQMIVQKSFLTQKKERINAICQVNNSILAIASVTKGIEMADITQLNNIQFNKLDAHSYSITELLSRNQGDLVSCSLDCLINVWQIESIDKMQLVKSFSGHKDGINTMIFISNKRLASGAKDNNIKLWDMKELKYIKTLSKHKKEINRMIYINKAKIGSSSLDMTMCLWDVDKGTCDFVVNLTRGLITSMFIAGESLYTGMEKEYAIIKWSMGKIAMESGIRRHEGLITQSICLSNGQIATCSMDQTIVIWNMKQEKLTGILVSHRTPIHSLAQLSDGRIISGSDDGMIKIWNFI